MNETQVAVTIYILDKEYRISCPQEERDSLLRSATYVDSKMREIRNSGRVIGAERIAVMTALNIANELLNSQKHKDDSNQTISRRIKNLQDKIEIALSTTNQLEL